MDSFLLKKIIANLLHPVPGIFIFMLAALLIRKRMPKLSGVILLAGIVTLLAFSSPLVSNVIVRQLESQFPHQESLPPDTTHVQVLAFGHIEAEDRASTNTLMAITLSRLTEAVRLWKTQPDSKLLLSGAPFLSSITHAKALADAAMDMGVPEEQIVLFETTRDTIDEIDDVLTYLAESKENADSSPARLVIVSTAIHLPRTKILLEKFKAEERFEAIADLEVDYAGADFLELYQAWYRFDSYYLRNVDRAFHEWVGIVWARIRR